MAARQGAALHGLALVLSLGLAAAVLAGLLQATRPANGRSWDAASQESRAPAATGLEAAPTGAAAAEGVDPPATAPPSRSMLAAWEPDRSLSILDPSVSHDQARRALAGPVSDLAINGSWLYALVEPGRLEVIDVAEPAAPRTVGTLHVDHRLRRLLLDESRAYLLGFDEPAVVVDVSDPTSPRLLGTLHLPGAPYLLRVANQRIYSLDERGRLWVFDASDPVKPVQVAATGSLLPAPTALTARDGLLYIADYEAGVVVVDATAPGQPHVIGHYTPTGTQLLVDLALVGSYLYVARDNGGLLILDVSDPTRPTPAALVPLTSPALAVAVVDTRAYVLESRCGLRLFDVSEPTAPVSSGFHGTTGLPWRLAASRAAVYLTETTMPHANCERWLRGE
jgi:hypothetical protein